MHALPHPPPPAFRHEALMYAGEAGFLAGTLPFVHDAVVAGEPILVVVGAAKIELLRSLVGDGDGAVWYVDMARVGANPAGIIPAWQEFECQRHESLLNVAFAD